MSLSLPAFSTKPCLVVIPTYNEAQNIVPMLREIWTHVADAHVLVVDDNSQDGTAQLVKELQVERPAELHLLERAGKLGLGTAYIAGFTWALERGYQSLIEIDADFSHSPSELPHMIAKLERAPVVIGSRYVAGGGTENWNLFRKFISMAGSFYARTILGMQVRDLTGGYNVWRAEVLRSIGLNSIRSEGYSFQIELKYRAFRAGYRLLEHPILFSERREGQSKMSSRIVFEALYRVWLIRLLHHRRPVLPAIEPIDPGRDVKGQRPAALPNKLRSKFVDH